MLSKHNDLNQTHILVSYDTWNKVSNEFTPDKLDLTDLTSFQLLVPVKLDWQMCHFVVIWNCRRKTVLTNFRISTTLVGHTKTNIKHFMTA